MDVEKLVGKYGRNNRASRSRKRKHHIKLKKPVINADVDTALVDTTAPVEVFPELDASTQVRSGQVGEQALQ